MAFPNRQPEYRVSDSVQRSHMSWRRGVVRGFAYTSLPVWLWIGVYLPASYFDVVDRLGLAWFARLLVFPSFVIVPTCWVVLTVRRRKEFGNEYVWGALVGTLAQVALWVLVAFAIVHRLAISGD